MEAVTVAGHGDTEVDAQFLLVHRFRSVAFAALCADVPESDLLEAFAVAVRADQRRRQFNRRHLNVVRAP